jgi:hypothetical protein
MPSSGQVALSWTASSGATGYYVKRSTTSGAEAQIASAASTTYTDTTAANGTLYYYMVSAYNSYGTSANSNEASATPSAPGNPPPAPTGLVAMPGNAQVSLTWNASTGATSYNVKRSITTANEAQLATTSSTTYTDNAVANGTTYYYVVSASNSSGISGNSNGVSAKPNAPPTAVNVTINTLGNRHPISPYVYGGSFPECSQVITDSGLSVVRWGGNGSSEYNWKLGTTNADNDYFFEDFNWNAWSINPNQMPTPPCPNPVPAQPDSVKWISDVRTAGSVPLTTMAMLNWVAQSPENPGAPPAGNGHWSFSVKKYGPQCKVDQYNTDAGNGIPAPSGPSDPNCTASNPTLLTADPNDAYFPLLDDTTQTCSNPGNCVYRSQWATALASAFNTAGTPHFYDMDNEIDIWGGTHRDIHPNLATYDELSKVYLTEAAKLKTWDPQAIRFGPVSCCWYFYWRSATGNSETSSHGGVDFLPWWLNEVAWSDAVVGNRSLDVFDIHAYPDGPNMTGFTLAQKQAAALRVYRDWWDPAYTSEASYIVGGGFSIEPVDSKPFRIPRMRALLHTIYPGTQFSITEWSAELAGAADFSTALGDAEAYGILGRERVDLASRWTAPDPANPNYQTLKLYRNYDGSHHTFGQTSISATHNADPNLFSVFAALGPANTPLTMMVVNKDPANAAQVTFTLNGFTTGTLTSYTLSQASPTSIVASSSQPWNNTQTFPPHSATLLVVTGAQNTVPAAEWDLNPDSIQIPAGGSFTFQPAITSATSGSASITLNTAQFDNSPAGLSLSIGKSTITQTPLTGDGAITVTAAGSVNPGFYHFTVTGTDSNTVQQTQGGWVLVQQPAATLTKTGDGQTGPHGTTLNLSVTVNPGSSGGTNNGATILFSTDAGSFGGSTKAIVTTNGSGVASVTLTLPSIAGAVHVTAEGPYGLGHPLATVTETAN